MFIRGYIAFEGLAVIERLTKSNQWKFSGVLPKAARALAIAWWSVLLMRGALPTLFAIAMGVSVGAVQWYGIQAAAYR